MTDFSPQPTPIEADAAKVKRDRISLTRGPVATMLLFLIGVIGMILVGWFWTYPTYADMQTAETDVATLEDSITSTQAKLDEARARTESREMTPEEATLSQGIAPNADPARIIRDILEIAALDVTNPDDDLFISNFAIEKPVMTGTYASIPVNLSFNAPLTSVDTLLSMLGDASAERRLGSVATISLGISVAGQKGDGATPSETQLTFLLREAQRHRITEQGRRDFQVLVQRRTEDYAVGRERVATALAAVRSAETRAASASGADLLTAQRELESLRSVLKKENDDMKKLERDLDSIRKEASVTMKIVLFAESDQTKDMPTKPAAAAITPAP